jgi:hypothetical protein
MNADHTAASEDAPGDLDAAVKRLYALFARKRRGSRPWADMDFPDDKAALPERVTVKQLGAEEFAHLSWHALCFDGDNPAAVRYFLPRLMEDYTRSVWSSDAEPAMLVSYMNRSAWRTWPPEEVRAVDEFFLAWLRAALRSPATDARPSAASIIALMAFADAPLAPAWDVLRADGSAEATSHLVHLVEAVNHSTRRRVLDRWREMWGKDGARDPAIAAVVSFLTSDETRARLEQAFFSADDPNVQGAISSALESLDSLRVSPR